MARPAEVIEPESRYQCDADSPFMMNPDKVKEKCEAADGRQHTSEDMIGRMLTV